VNAIAPGYTRTKLIEEALRNGSLREDWMMERVPMGRLAKPEEIAGVVCFLASDAAAYITGQVITADGGWTVQGQSRMPDWLSAGRSAE
jgi:NAD(P)-dependent dehydrogenase (short-subunit alcohol dehydrogenase family)